MTYDQIVSKVAESLGLSPTLTNKIYKTYWKVVREHVSSLPLKEDLTEEQFLELQPNVNIPSIGKLYVTLDRYKRMQRQHEIFVELREKKNAAHQET